jgi:predicted site-specific integrase-resolvase
MEEYLLLEEAALRRGISPEALSKLVESGKIRAVKINGKMAVAVKDSEIASVLAILDDGKDDELVSISEAARRLGIYSCLVSNWVKYGWVKVQGRGERGAKMVPFKQVQALANLRAQRGYHRGSRLLPKSVK